MGEATGVVDSLAESDSVADSVSLAESVAEAVASPVSVAAAAQFASWAATASATSLAVQAPVMQAPTVPISSDWTAGSQAQDASAQLTEARPSRMQGS